VVICKGNVCQLYWRTAAQLKGTAQNAFTEIIMQWEVSLFPVWQHTMLFYENHDVHTGVNDSILRCCFALGFASVLLSRSTINDKKQVEIRSWTGMLGDILEKNIFSGNKIVKILN